MAFTSSPKENYLLAALPDSEFQALLPHLEPVAMPAGQALCESGSAATHAYFPTSSIVSLQYVLESGSSVEVGMVGAMGVVGVSVLLGGNSTPTRAVVLSAGRGFRLRSKIAKEQFDKAGQFMFLTLLYTQALITQVGQIGACNRHHRLDQRFCRWLLLTVDRMPETNLVMTQELIANVLGVRREAVTEAALKLQRAGLIRYARGHIDVIDRHGLEQRACECYEIIRMEYDRLFTAMKTEDAPIGQWQHAPLPYARARREGVFRT